MLCLDLHSFLTYFEDEEEKEERLEEGGVHLQNLLWIMGKIPKLHPSNPRKISPGTINNMPSYIFHSSYIYKQQWWCLSVCVRSAWKILPVTARSPEITHLNTLNMAFLTVSVFGQLEFACTGGFTKN